MHCALRARIRAAQMEIIIANGLKQQGSFFDLGSPGWTSFIRSVPAAWFVWKLLAWLKLIDNDLNFKLISLNKHQSWPRNVWQCQKLMWTKQRYFKNSYILTARSSRRSKYVDVDIYHSAIFWVQLGLTIWIVEVALVAL